MKNKKRYEQYCNRSMPLLTVEYWWRGEYFELAKWTGGTIRYNPLFVYWKSKGTDVYYDMNNPIEASDDPLNFYFKSRKEKFKILADKYEEESRQLVQLIKENKQENFTKIFKLLIRYWPKLTAILLVGELVSKKGFKKISRRAYNLRKKIEDVEYKSAKHLVKLIRQKFPSLANLENFLTFAEIESGKIPQKKELIERKRGCIYFEGKIYTGLSIAQFAKLKKIKILENGSPIKQNTRSFKGVSAMIGKVVGRVKVIFENGQLEKIKKGDILVTPMTTPDFIIAMRKAIAFITDEGGITCHAAITAREMKKPCIIGTKIATQVLKDGDLVEVDAHKGLVRILKT